MDLKQCTELLHAAMSRLAAKGPALKDEKSLRTHLTAALDDVLDSGKATEGQDILIDTGEESILVELKYARKKFIGRMGGQEVELKDGALDASCHDFLDDVANLEERIACNPGTMGLALILTNDPRAWTPASGTQWDEFRIHEGREIHGKLQWTPETSSKTKRKYREVVIRGKYKVEWRDFAEFEGVGARTFRYGVVAVDRLPAKGTEPDPPARYPTGSSWRDHALSAGKALVGAVPYVGAAGTELISLIVPPLERARIDFINDLGQRLQRVEEIVDEENLASFVFGAVQSAMATSDREKRELLRNAALNVAMGRGGNLTEYFRSLIDRLGMIHIRVLRFCAAPPAVQQMLKLDRLVEDLAQRVVSEYPELRGQEALVEASVQELWDLRLLPFPRRPPPVLSADMIELHKLTGPRLSPLGREFLDFIRDPQKM